MKVLTAAEMRLADQRTIDAGIPSLVLMENAGHRAVEFLQQRFSPLRSQRILVLCGKGNNGGDGLVIARQLHTRCRPAALWTVLADAAPGHIAMMDACGCPYTNTLSPEMHSATLIIDALLGTGLSGPPREPYLSLIHRVNTQFPGARIVAVDIPSGLSSDTALTEWPYISAHHTVTFTAPQPCHVLQPASSSCGELIVAAIGTREEYCQSNLNVSTPAAFAHMFAPRVWSSHKGSFGHVLIAGGAAGKPGAAEMAGMAALRAGAGLVTLSTTSTSGALELMREPLTDWPRLASLSEGKTILAIGPGLGVQPALVRAAVEQSRIPLVIDADGLNSLAGSSLPSHGPIVMTPHPGEMSRLTGLSAGEIQGNRIETARRYATGNRVTIVLKGANTITAFPDGEVWINSTGGPALATAGSGDILTGLISGLMAQFPNDPLAIPAAVWIHGRAADLAARQTGEKSLIATGLLAFVPEAMEECAPISV
jgi:NAD(P)H-hydrate epimerase